MLEDYGVSNYFVQFGEMEIHTTKFYFYMVKVNNGILVKIRQNDMMTYFVDMVVKNQEQAKSIILGYVLESQKIDMEQLKEEALTPTNEAERLEFNGLGWFDTIEEEETILKNECEKMEGETMNKLTKILKYANEKNLKIGTLDLYDFSDETSAHLDLYNHKLNIEFYITKANHVYNVGAFEMGTNKELGGKRGAKTQKEVIVIIEEILKEKEEKDNEKDSPIAHHVAIGEEKTIVPFHKFITKKENETRTKIIDYVFDNMEKTHNIKQLIKDILKIFQEANQENYTVLSFDYFEHEKNIIDPTLYINLDMNITVLNEKSITTRMIYLDDYLLNN